MRRLQMRPLPSKPLGHAPQTAPLSVSMQSTPLKIEILLKNHKKSSKLLKTRKIIANCDPSAAPSITDVAPWTVSTNHANVRVSTFNAIMARIGILTIFDLNDSPAHHTTLDLSLNELNFCAVIRGVALELFQNFRLKFRVSFEI